MSTLLHDIRFALRTFRRAPAFAGVAIATLALGVGANTAIFSVLDAVVLRPLPYAAPEELVRIDARHPFSLKIMEYYQEHTRALAGLTGYTSAGRTLLTDGTPQVLSVGVVASEHFQVLGRPPALGRTFLAEEELAASERVVILSHGLWQGAFGGDPDILGRRVALRGPDGEERTIIGVMPADHQPLGGGWQAWIPHTVDRDEHEYNDMNNLVLVGRLATGATRAGALDEARRLGEQMRARDGEHYTEARLRSLAVTPLLESVISGIRPTLLLLQGAVGMVLLIGCANIANLLLSRAVRRADEMAVRSALGARRGRLIRQLLTESALLGLAGSAAGWLLADVAVSVLAPRLPASLPRALSVSPDVRLLAVAVLFGLGSSLLFGLAPALRLTGLDLRARLSPAGRGTVGPGGHRLNAGLVVAEIALSVVLLSAAGLMIKSFWKLQDVSLGFEPARLLTLRLLPPPTRYGDDARTVQYYDQVLERVRAVPGVESCEAIDSLPLAGGAIGLTYLAEGRAREPGNALPFASYRAVTPGYFDQLGIPVLTGRRFDPADRSGAMEVGMVNRTLAERLWPGEDPVGKEIRWDEENPWFTVVGVVADVKQRSLDAASSDVIYRPAAQDGWRRNLYLTVRTTGEPGAAADAVLHAIGTVDAEVPVVNVRSMEDVVGRTLGPRRLVTGLLGAFAAVALLLAGLGIYGVTSYAVSRRTREIGVRMALGATRRAVITDVLVRGGRAAALGVTLGLLGALAASRTLTGMLFQVSAADPLVMLLVAAALGGLAVAAAYLPARRAARVDPMTALRAE